MHDVFVTSFAMYLIKVYKVRDFLPIFGNMTPGFTFEQRQVNIFISCMGEGPKNDLCVKIMEFDACVLACLKFPLCWCLTSFLQL